MRRLRSSAPYLALVAVVAGSCNSRLAPGQCAIDLDCPAPAVCERGACVVLPSDGSSEVPTAAGCQKDTDCKGDRICVGAVCVAPPAPPPADAGPFDLDARSAAGSDGGPPGQEATVKFCHLYLVDGVDVTLTMTAAGKRFPALTHECSPCQSLPANQLLNFSIFHPSGESVLDFSLALEPGDSVFLGTFQNDQPVLRLGHVIAPATCQSVDPFGSL